MAEKIADLITKTNSNDNLSAFFSIYDSYDAIIKSVAKKNEAEWHAIAKEAGLEAKISIHSQSYASIFFDNESLRARRLSIGFQFGGAMLNKLYFGIFDAGNLEENARVALKRTFETHFAACQPTSSWPVSQYWAEYQDGRELLKTLNSPQAKIFNIALREKLTKLQQVVAVL